LLREAKYRSNAERSLLQRLSAWLRRVLRGGSWVVHPANLRSANRGVIDSIRYRIVGFRVARTLLAP
jgi:formylglycine-generating enzyme required for sulfatase activity